MGVPDMGIVQRALRHPIGIRAVESRIGHQVQIAVLTDEEWNADDTGFLRTVRDAPLLSLL